MPHANSSPSHMHDQCSCMINHAPTSAVHSLFTTRIAPPQVRSIASETSREWARRKTRREAAAGGGHPGGPAAGKDLDWWVARPAPQLAAVFCTGWHGMGRCRGRGASAAPEAMRVSESDRRF
jgi:hypothetical protein